MNWLVDWKMPSAEGHCQVQIATDLNKAIQLLEADSVDIFVVDLVLDPSKPDKKTGAEFIKNIVDRTNAGIILHTSLSSNDAEANDLINLGADDYIQKPSDIDTFRSRISALWRRLQFVRPTQRSSLGHNNRTFLIGEWRFVIGSRFLKNATGGELRLSPTEHAFLRHLCVDEQHQCDRVTFNLSILGRRSFEENARVDNLVYRIRKKLGDSLTLVSDDGTYRLLGATELKPSSSRN